MTPIEHALSALIETYCNSKKITPVHQELINLLAQQDTFEGKVQAAETFCSKQCEELSEVIFDLLLMQHMSLHKEDESYFEGEEWLEIEEQTLDRGSELLNVLVYIDEAKNEGIQISADDFMNEFLLADLEENQDEIEIYEVLIKNNLSDAGIPDLLDLKNQMEDENPLKEIFVPLIVFLNNPDQAPGTQRGAESLSPFEQAVYTCLYFCYK